VSARLVAILVVLLAVLGGAALLYQHQERTRRPDSVATLGRPLLKDLKGADVAAIRIAEPKAILTISRKDDAWLIAERGDFPADVTRVREFVLKAIGLKVGQSEPIGEKDRARFNLDASGTQVEFRNAEGKTLAAMTLGKKHFKREPDNPERAPGDGRFVALPGEAGTVYLVGDALPQATARSAEWIERTSFQVEKVRALEVRYPDGSGYGIERAADNAEWRLAGAAAGEKVDVSRANAASYSLSLLELADVAPKDAQNTGLDKATTIQASTFDGLAYAIKVGRLEGENYYVSFTSSGDAKSDAKDAERSKRLAERAPRERLLSQHVLLIPKSKLEDTLKKRAELLEQKPKK
jgi:hypothetical protein